MASSRLRWAGRLDMYRKIPADLMEGSRRGSIFSYLAAAVMLVLFLLETKSYFSKTLVSDLALDVSNQDKIRVNFNITMMDLKCEYAVVDVVSVLGTEQNVTAHVNKWHVDAAGVRQRFQGRNRAQHDIELFDSSITDSIDDLHEDGIDAISLDETSFNLAIEQNEYVFVDFYANWCSHCRDLAPTWETLAEVMAITAEHIVDQNKHKYSDEEYEHATKVELPVIIAKVDCVLHEKFCMQQGIRAYPTLRLFVDGKRWQAGDYMKDRTVVSMVDYLKEIEDYHKGELLKTDNPLKLASADKALKQRMNLEHDDEDEEGLSDEERAWADRVKRRKKRLHHSWVDEDHPGCQLSGHLMLDRVPGNFHIQARSAHHDIAPHMTNASHEVHSLTMGDPGAQRMIQTGRVFVPNEVKDKLDPMKGNVYMNDNLHEAYHHYLKVVPTSIDGLKFGKRDQGAYQIIQSSQLAYYEEQVVPEAKFIFDLSPVAVSYRKKSGRWYDYITSVMAIVGGTFTVIGMLESSIRAVASRRRIR